MDKSTVLAWAATFVLAYVAGPVSLIWGWLRWVHQPRSWAVPATVSFIAFVIASTSAALGVGMIGYGYLGGFEQGRDYVAFWRIVGIGGVTSLVGILVSLGGIWAKSPLRWHALASAVSALAFWMVATTWP